MIRISIFLLLLFGCCSSDLLIVLLVVGSFLFVDNLFFPPVDPSFISLWLSFVKFCQMSMNVFLLWFIIPDFLLCDPVFYVHVCVLASVLSFQLYILFAAHMLIQPCNKMSWIKTIECLSALRRLSIHAFGIKCLNADIQGLMLP